MKLRAIVPDTKINASVWWRITQPFRYLSREHNTKIVTYDEADTMDVKNAIVFIHRLICPDPRAYVDDLKRRGAYKVIYSMDDYTTNADVLRKYLADCGGMTKAAIEGYVANVPQQIKIIQACDDVVVSTPQLAELIDETTNKLVTIIENGIPLDWWYERVDQKSYVGDSNIVYIGWAGGRRPDADLADMAKAWGVICNQYDNVRFVVGGYQPPVIDEHIDLDKKIRIPWASFDEWPLSMKVDIGCCPLADTEYNQGKSANKWLEYTASGAATIVSPTVYSRYINNTANGLMAYDVEDWIQHLSTLIEDGYVGRKRINKIALYDVENYNSLDATIIDWNVYLNESKISYRQHPRAS